jgi:hypothetical protein
MFLIMKEFYIDKIAIKVRHFLVDKSVNLMLMAKANLP